MATNRRLLRGVDPSAVFDVLRDGRTYGNWVVGASVRAQDPGWPEQGTRLHYRVGWNPLRKDDKTVSLAYEPDRRLELEAVAWPVGTARIVLTAEPTAEGTVVTLVEHPARGIAARLHNPAADLLVKVRNVETLRRLEREVRRRSAPA
jgi:hypothetical protein